MRRRIFLCTILDNFIGFSDHFSDFWEFLLSVGVLDMCFHFILGGSLEGIGVDVGVLSVGKGVVIEGTAGVGVGLGFHDFASDVFELSFKGEFVFGLFL